MFLVQVEDRSESTIREIIERHVMRGSIIRTDCSRGYSFLGTDSNYKHETVNHSECFKNDLGVHTITIEGKLSGLKSVISKRNR